MLPAVTANVTNSMVVGAPAPAGLVGRGDGAPAGAVKLVVRLIEVPAANVVPFWNVMVELHDPRFGKFRAVPTVKLEAVPVPLPETVPHGKAAAGLDEEVGAAVGALVAPPDEATVPGVGTLLVLEQPETTAAATTTPNSAVSTGRFERPIMKCEISQNLKATAGITSAYGPFEVAYLHESAFPHLRYYY